MVRVVLTALPVSVFFAAGCDSGGSSQTGTDPNAQSKPTWTATVTTTPRPKAAAGPNKQAALRVSLAVYAQANGPAEHSYKNQCFGPKRSRFAECWIIGKRCVAWVMVAFNGPHDSAGHPFRITNDCSPPTRGYYPFYKGCPRRPGCVARAKRVRSFPRNAAIGEGYPRHPTHGPCGSFVDPYDSRWVSVSKQHTTCATALALAHAVHWRTAKTHSLGGDLFVISGFPGWHCSSGMGQARCTNGRQEAQWGFQNMIRWAHPKR